MLFGSGMVLLCIFYCGDLSGVVGVVLKVVWFVVVGLGFYVVGGFVWFG